MNKILTYEDLLKEKQQLEVLLQAQKELLRYDLQELRGQLLPAKNTAQDTFSFLGKIFKRKKSVPLLTGGANRVIDLVVKKLLLARSGWLTRLVVPLLIKNFSSHLIAENKGKFVSKLFHWIGKKNANGKSARETH
jgi:hypothetical protein